LKVRFLADANFNQKIITGLLLRELEIDCQLPQDVIPDRMKDPQVLELGAALDRVIVTHDCEDDARLVSNLRGGSRLSGDDPGP
jgi:predicted nuclease of predicted toxin-antitoxin system